MKINDWDKLRVFYHVALSGSFTHASEKLCLSQSAVSRQILALEASLLTSLFSRRARGLVLTEAGTKLLKAAQEVFHKVQEVETSIEADLSEPQGPLRISAPSYFSEKWLVSRLAQFQKKYPKVQLDFMVSDGFQELERGHCDLAIRSWSSGLSDLMQQKFLTYRMGVYASHDYLMTHARPEGIHDLKSHHLVLHEADINALSAPKEEGSPKGGGFNSNELHILLKSNSYGFLEKTLSQGRGIGFLPNFDVGSQRQRIIPKGRQPLGYLFFLWLS